MLRPYGAPYSFTGPYLTPSVDLNRPRSTSWHSRTLVARTSTGGRAMQYMVLIYDNEKDWAKRSDAERNTIYAEYGAFGESLAKSGNYKTGSELQPTSSATTVRVRGSKTQVTDGPFAETREQLGGYYL